MTSKHASCAYGSGGGFEHCGFGRDDTEISCVSNSTILSLIDNEWPIIRGCYYSKPLGNSFLKI